MGNATEKSLRAWEASLKLDIERFLQRRKEQEEQAKQEPFLPLAALTKTVAVEWDS